jgi:hypothetical protein
LGHIASKDGILVDPKCNEAIMQIPHTHSEKSMQSFFRKINFVKIFVPNFAEKIKHLQHMIKKDVQLKWKSIENDSFDNINAAILIPPALQSLDFEDFVHICIRSFSCSNAHSKRSTRERIPHKFHER